MASKRRLMVAGLTMALMAGLGASGSGSGQNDNPWEDSTASGGSSGQRDEGHDDDQGTAPDTASEAATVTGVYAQRVITPRGSTPCPGCS